MPALFGGIGRGVYCPSCVAAGAGQARAANVDAPRTLYDSIALTLPLASLILMWPLTIAAAPAALVISISKWKQPLSLVRRSRWRFVRGDRDFARWRFSGGSHWSPQSSFGVRRSRDE